MKRLLYYLLVLALGIFAGEWLAWRQFNGQKRPVKPQADTLVIRDTFVAEKPVYLTRKVVDTVYFPADTVRVRDTLYIPLPIEQKVYGDTRYRAVVSGIRPSLDTISIYQSTTIINRVREVSLRPRWSIGLQAGVGITIDGGIRATPYFGAGVQYNLIQFGYDKRRNQDLD